MGLLSVSYPCDVPAVYLSSVTEKALVYANPLRQIETITVSQNAQTVGLGVRYLCQFLVGQDPLSTVVPELKLLVNASNRIAKLTDLKTLFGNAYTRAVSSITGDDPLLTEWVNAAITPVVDNEAKKFASTNAFLSNPATSASLDLLNTYANAAEQVQSHSPHAQHPSVASHTSSQRTTV